MTAPSSILAWRIPTDRGAWRATVHGGGKETQLSDSAQHQQSRSVLWKSTCDRQSGLKSHNHQLLGLGAMTHVF